MEITDRSCPCSFLPPSTTTKLTSLCNTTVPVRYSWFALASTLNFLAGFCRFRILYKEGCLNYTSILWLTHILLYVSMYVCVLSLLTNTCTQQCERHQWGPPLTSWPSFLSSALLSACGLRWPLRELCKEGTQLENMKKNQWELERKINGNCATNFCLLAICALTWASTFVGSWTASVPNTLIRLEIRTDNKSEYQLHSLLL